MEEDKKSNGALVGSIIVIIILVVGGIYLLKNTAKKNVAPENQNIATDTNDLLTSPVDSTTNLETELDNVDLDSLDSEI